MAMVCWFVGVLGADFRRVLIWLGLTGVYIMLFTPMNEVNSYVMLAPALGLWTYWHVIQGARRTALAIAALSVSMVLLPNFVRPLFGHHIGNEFGKFWCPLMTLVFLGILLRRMKHGPERKAPQPAPAHFQPATP
jgi:hypothetical protein